MAQVIEDVFYKQSLKFKPQFYPSPPNLGNNIYAFYLSEDV
jgi:hypothetical protein